MKNHVHYYLLRELHLMTYKPQVTLIRWSLILINELDPPEVKKPIGKPKENKKDEKKLFRKMQIL